MMTFKRQKFQRLTVGCGFDRHTVPIFHASCGGNRTTPLLKTLMTNYCINDCKFCPFRSERKINRDKWDPKELSKIALRFFEMGKIRGVFLSSSVQRDPDLTFQLELETARELRKNGFKEYIHLKIMPGTSRELIKESVELADRVGINIEFPGKEYYEEMKLFLDFKEDILKRFRWLAEEVEKCQKEGKCKAGMDSQMVVGAGEETDREIIKFSGYLYQKLKVRRVYYSRFEPVKNTPLENKKPENPWREYRLYQSSFLLRDYGFRSREFVFDEMDMLSLKEDPKFLIAKENELLVDINHAKKEELIKVPGIGLKTADRIIERRPFRNLGEIKKAGVIVNRALPFIEISGSKQEKLSSYVNSTLFQFP
ncbi:MAG: radical SAM protein [Candidatus Aenigmatarchaeota archaeon]